MEIQKGNNQWIIGSRDGGKKNNLKDNLKILAIIQLQGLQKWIFHNDKIPHSLCQRQKAITLTRDKWDQNVKDKVEKKPNKHYVRMRNKEKA